MKMQDYMYVEKITGFYGELIKPRVKKTKEEQKGVLNLVRFAVPRNQLNDSHINYTIKACKAVYDNRKEIHPVAVVRGAELRLRHFQSGIGVLPIPEN